MFVSCVCCVGGGLCDGLITHSGSATVCVYLCVYMCVCDLETSIIRLPRSHLGYISREGIISYRKENIGINVIKPINSLWG